MRGSREDSDMEELEEGTGKGKKRSFIKIKKYLIKKERRSTNLTPIRSLHKFKSD